MSEYVRAGDLNSRPVGDKNDTISICCKVLNYVFVPRDLPCFLPFCKVVWNHRNCMLYFF